MLPTLSSKDGKDGKAATATTTENPDGSHTVTITNPDGTKNEFVVKNGVTVLTDVLQPHLFVIMETEVIQSLLQIQKV